MGCTNGKAVRVACHPKGISNCSDVSELMLCNISVKTIALQCFILRHLYYLLVLQLYRLIYSECILSCRSVGILFLYTTNPYLFLLYKVHSVLRCLCTQECCLCLFFHARSSATSKRKRTWLASLRVLGDFMQRARQQPEGRSQQGASRLLIQEDTLIKSD